METTKVSEWTIIRTGCLVLALLNAGLALFGKSPLPIDDAMIEDAVTFVFLVGSSVAAWWKNNSFSKEAKKADELLRKLKGAK